MALDNKMMSRNRYFSEPICALETISNIKGIHIPVHQVVTGHDPVLADAIGMERLGNSLQSEHAKLKPRRFVVRPITSAAYRTYDLLGV